MTQKEKLLKIIKHGTEFLQEFDETNIDKVEDVHVSMGVYTDGSAKLTIEVEMFSEEAVKRSDFD